MTPTGPASRVVARRAPGVLVVGAIGNGLGAAAAMWLAQRHLGLERFTPLAQLWTLWSLVATGLVFGFQQWEIARSATDANAERRPVSRRVITTLGAVTIATGVLATALGARLFDSSALVWPLATASLVPGTAATGLAYGYLARRRRFSWLAGLMVGENLARLGTTVALGLLAAPATWYALTVPIGFVFAVSPLLLHRARAGQRTGRHDMRLPITALAAIGIATSFVVFGSPLLLGAAGGRAAAVSTLFLVLVPIRVPFLLANSSLPAVMVAASDMVVAGRTPRLRTILGQLLVAAVAVGGLGAVSGWFLGDLLAELVFDAGGVLGAATYALLGGSAGLSLVATFTNVIVIALRNLRRTAMAWTLVGVSGVAFAAAGTLATPPKLVLWMLVCVVAILGTHATVLTRG